MNKSHYVIRNSEGEEIATFIAQSGIAEQDLSIEEFGINADVQTFLDDFSNVDKK